MPEQIAVPRDGKKLPRYHCMYCGKLFINDTGLCPCGTISGPKGLVKTKERRIQDGRRTGGDEISGTRVWARQQQGEITDKTGGTIRLTYKTKVGAVETCQRDPMAPFPMGWRRGPDKRKALPKEEGGPCND